MKNIKKELKGKLSEEQLNKLKKACSEDLALIRHSLICDFPFTAAISMRLDLIPVRDKRVRTACTDGKSIYWDMDFLSSLKKPEKMFVMAHEIWHLCLMHLSRCQTRNRELFNIASDMEVNQLLVDNAAGKDIEPPKELLFPPDKLKGKSAEVIYDYLLKQAQKQQKKQQQQAKSSQSGKGSQTNSDSEGNDGDKQSGNSQSGGNNSKKNENGKDTGKLTGQFDKHTYTDDNGDGDIDEKVTDQWGEVGYDDDFRPNVPSDIAEKMREAAIAAAQQCQREKGDLPAGVKQLLDKVLKSEIDWKTELCNYVTSCYNCSNRTWLPPNRRHVYNELYFQSHRSERIEGVVAIDTSGSCLGDLPKFFGELKGLVESFGNYRITLIQCDAAVDKVDVYDYNDNPFDPEVKIEASGGGGTSFVPVFKYIEKEGIAPNFLIYLTDSYGDAPKNPPNYPVLWVLTNDGDINFCNWGKKIKFKTTAYDY